MPDTPTPPEIAPLTTPARYHLESQVGFLLRLANQRHAGIFQALAPYDLTPTQFAALVRLAQLGTCSQNELGRQTAMDVATIKGVVDRLRKKGMVAVQPDPGDKRRAILSIASGFADVLAPLTQAGAAITAETLKPLTASEQETFLALLRKIC